MFNLGTSISFFTFYQLDKKRLFFFIVLVIWTFPPLSFSQNANEIKPDIDSLSLVINNSTDEEKLKSIIEYVEAFYKISPKSTIKYADIGLGLSLSLNDEKAKITLYRNKGKCLIALANFDEGFQYITNALQLSEQLNDSINIGRATLDLGIYYYEKGNYQKARNYFENSIITLEKQKAYQKILHAQSFIANTYIVQGAFLNTVNIFDSLLSFCKKHRLDSTQIIINRAITLHNIEKPSRALETFFQGRNLFQKRRNTFAASVTEHHIGYLLDNVGLYDEALKYYLKVYHFFSKNGTVNNLSHVSLSLAELMLELGRNDEAEAYYKEALQLKKQKEFANLVDIYLALGRFEIEKNDFPKAMEYLNLGLENAKTLGIVRGEAFYYIYISELYLKKADYKKAESSAKKAVRLNTGLQIKRKVISAYENLAKAYEHQGKFALAIAAKNKMDSLNTNLKGPNEILKITQEVVLETLKKHEKKELISNNIKTAGKKRWIFYLCAGLIVFIGIGTYILNKRKKESLTKPANASLKLSKEEKKQLNESLEKTIKEHQPHLNPNLNLRDLALLIPTSNKKLSALLNQHLEISFYDYINELRVKAFLQKLDLGRNDRYSIIGLANECGFKSKSSFYRVFKKHVGLTPLAYIKQKT